MVLKLSIGVAAAIIGTIIMIIYILVKYWLLYKKSKP